jgi:16S rRNA (cytosine967-C5)-methyltransferase
MRLGGRLAAAIEVLDDIERRHRPAADALKDWGLSHRFAGSGDRAGIGNIVYDALRHKRSAAWIMGDDQPLALALGALLQAGGSSPQTILAELAGDRFAPDGIDEDNLAATGEKKLADAPAGVRADCPEWCEALLDESFGQDWTGEGAALAARPPLDMRVNTLKADRAKVLGALARAGARPCLLAPEGIRIEPIAGFGRHPNVQAEPAFQKGWFEVQDEGSQLVSLLAGAAPGMQVLDFCAGAGGKTLALSAAMDNKGQIFAHDAEKQRLAPIFDRLKRAGCRNVQVAADSAELSSHEGQMDLVLVDAPCTGSGTWRRRPDAKWRLTARQLEARQAEQDAILETASRYVKPGGSLAYVTCSIFRQENAERVASFASRHPEFSSVDHRDLWRSVISGSEDAARFDAAAGISLSPALTGTDGFYFCALRRAA